MRLGLRLCVLGFKDWLGLDILVFRFRLGLRLLVLDWTVKLRYYGLEGLECLEGLEFRFILFLSLEIGLRLLGVKICLLKSVFRIQIGMVINA